MIPWEPYLWRKEEKGRGGMEIVGRFLDFGEFESWVVSERGREREK